MLFSNVEDIDGNICALFNVHRTHRQMCGAAASPPSESRAVVAGTNGPKASTGTE